MNIVLAQFLLTLFFLTVIFLHLVKKNFMVALIYAAQSLIIIMFLLNSFLKTGALSMIAIIILTFMVKVILAPSFIIRLVKKHQLKFSASTYVNTPLTLFIIMALAATAYSDAFAPLVKIIPAQQPLASLALTSILSSFFLIVNRKGALSQVIGILSLENSIVAFAIFTGLEQAPSLQIGIIFNICIWVIITNIFISMLYKHFGSLNVTEMKNLND